MLMRSGRLQFRGIQALEVARGSCFPGSAKTLLGFEEASEILGPG